MVRIRLNIFSSKTNPGESKNCAQKYGSKAIWFNGIPWMHSRLEFKWSKISHKSSNTITIE